MFLRKTKSTVAIWLVPLSYAVGAFILGTTVPRLAQLLFPSFVSTISVNVAIGIYSAVASGMLSLTGIVFSLTFVMVQFSATAYSPRLVLWIARDPFLSHATGVFTATFIYALSSLAWVDRNGSGRVPLLGFGVCTALLVSSIIMFIGLIQRVSMLQVTRMLIFTGDQGRKIIEQLYPPIAVPASNAPSESLSSVTQTLLHCGNPRVVEAVRISDLVGIACNAGCVIEVLAAVGDSVMDATPILRVGGAAAPLPESVLKSAVELGAERTFEQDPKYAIRLLVRCKRWTKSRIC
jgi:uncharacterized membrane protein